MLQFLVCGGSGDQKALAITVRYVSMNLKRLCSSMQRESTPLLDVQQS
jgi:hypothetical protein